MKRNPVGAISADYISRPCNINNSYAGLVTQREAGQDPAGSQATTGKNNSISTETSSRCGHDNSNKTSSSDGTIIPSTSPSSDKQSSTISHISRGSETELPPGGRDFNRSQGGADMVDAGSPEIQWCTTAGCTTRYGDRIGCFPTGLGSNVKRPGIENRWPMVSQRARDAHQLPGVVSSFSGNPSICQGEEWHQYSGQNRRLSQGLHKSLWGNTFMANECSDCRDVEVVHRSLNLSDGRISSGSRESSGRHGVTDSQGSLRLDASSSSFFTDQEEDGPTRGGYVCISADTPAPSLLQLEAGSGFRGNRCLYTELESVSWVCQSPMVSHISNTGKDSTGESLGDLGGANVEDTTMVSPPPSATVWLPSLDPTQENVVISPTKEEFIMPAGVPQLVVWPLFGNSVD